MNVRKTMLALAVSSIIAAPVYAQTRDEVDVQRDQNQQQRIENGLQSGQLNTREAGELEHEQTHIDQMERRADRNGSISAQEQSRIDAAQDRASHDINSARHNGVGGNPYSTSSQRMQSDVQRDVNQQQRIESGLRDGSVTNREAGQLERGQAHDDHAQARAAADGRIGSHEQRNVQNRENRQSAHIHEQKQDAQRHHG